MQSKIKSGAINEVGISGWCVLQKRNGWNVWNLSNYLHSLNVVQERGGSDVRGGPFIYQVKYFY
jgi:hypothetical protein